MPGSRDEKPDCLNRQPRARGGARIRRGRVPQPRADARSLRERMSSLRYVLLRCSSTVLTVTKSAWAISLLDMPSAASWATRRSARGECVHAGHELLARPGPRGGDLVVSTLGERAGSQHVREVDASTEPLASFGPPARPPQRGTEVDERMRVLEAGGRVRQHTDRLAEMCLCCSPDRRGRGPGARLRSHAKHPSGARGIALPPRAHEPRRRRLAAGSPRRRRCATGRRQGCRKAQRKPCRRSPSPLRAPARAHRSQDVAWRERAGRT